MTKRMINGIMYYGEWKTDMNQLKDEVRDDILTFTKDGFFNQTSDLDTLTDEIYVELLADEIYQKEEILVGYFEQYYVFRKSEIRNAIKEVCKEVAESIIESRGN